MTYRRIFKKTNMAGVTSGAGIAYPSASQKFTPCCIFLNENRETKFLTFVIHLKNQLPLGVTFKKHGWVRSRTVEFHYVFVVCLFFLQFNLKRVKTSKLIILCTLFMVSNQQDKISPDLKFQLPLYRWCSVTEQFSFGWLSTSHLSRSAWS